MDYKLIALDLDGTLKTKVIPGNNEDVGLVFRASNGGLESFWEDPTAQYYTALINKEGIVILGKVNYNGNVWSLLGSKAMVDAYSSLNESFSTRGFNTISSNLSILLFNIFSSVCGRKLSFTDSK